MTTVEDIVEVYSPECLRKLKSSEEKKVPKTFIEEYPAKGVVYEEAFRFLLEHYYMLEDIDIDLKEKDLCYILNSGYIKVRKKTNGNGTEEGIFYLTKLTDKKDLKLREKLLKRLKIIPGDENE